MVSGKTRAANDITVGDAETLHDLGMKIKADCKGNEYAIWMYLLSLPRRQQEQLAQVWGVTTCGQVAKALALPEAPHA